MKGFFGKISEKFKEKVNTIVMTNNSTSSVSDEIPNKNKDSQTKISNNANSSTYNQEKKEKVLSEDESRKLKSLISIEDEDDNQVYNFMNEKNEEEEEEYEEEEEQEKNKKDLSDETKNSEMNDFYSFPIDKENKLTKNIISKRDISEIENFQKTSSNFIISRLYEIGERVNLKDIEYRFICEMKKQKGGVMSLLTFIKKEEDLYEEYIIEIDNQFLYLIKNEEESNTNPNEEGKADNNKEIYKQELNFIRKISLRLNLSQLYKINIKRKENNKDDKYVLLMTLKCYSIKEEYINDNYHYIEIVLYKNEADALLLELRKVGFEYKFKFDIIGL